MINEIFAKYGSDKADHNYGPFYEKWLPKNPRKILEIGVWKGASLKAWRDIFPAAELHGLDLFELDPIPAIENVRFWKGNQTDQTLLHALRRENFDLIIDDGSHNTREVLTTFFGLAHEGCHYFIEDLQCQKELFFNTGLPSVFWPDSIFDSEWNYSELGQDIIYIRC